MRRRLLLKVASVMLLFQGYCAVSAGNSAMGTCFIILSTYFWFHRNWIK